MVLRVAFPLIGRGGWTGGEVYLKNTLRLIRSRLEHEIDPLVFLSPEENIASGAEIASLTDGRVIVAQSFARAGRGTSLARALVLGADVSLEKKLRSAGVDATFEVASYYGWRFGLPTIAWITDFQHRHMREMFSGANWWRRELGFRAQIGSGRTIMLSSDTARVDLERFYPAASGRAHVVRFSIDLDPAVVAHAEGEIRAAYSLPERFFFLPNQFWQHKNHQVVVEALAQLKDDGALDTIPPIILTGNPSDPRNPDHFGGVFRRVEEMGLAARFRYLGLLPYAHVLALSASCIAQIQPSLFEGWSTPIEEAKALGTPLILSDTPIHREQAPNALFFSKRSARACADALIAMAAARPIRPSIDELQASQSSRLDAHAKSLLATVQSAVRSRACSQR